MRVAAVTVSLLATAGVAWGAPATIRLDPTKQLGPVNKLVFGNNMLAYQEAPEYADLGAGLWDPENGRSVPEMVQLAKEAGLTVSRWPGGCAAHTYNWKLTVGPLAQRPHIRFGLSQFLQNCKDIGALPVLTVAEYWGEPQDAADLVEYLNAPNDGSNPNGGTDWAALRAAEGYPQPWRVQWFEYGNESDHGNHGQGDAFKRWTPEQYAQRYLAYRAAMKAVDPTIKLGAVLENTATPDFGEWTRTVLRLAGRQMDFAIHHAYRPGYYSDDDPPEIAQRLFTVALSTPAQWHDHYAALRALMRELAGREIPLAITEYNGHFVQEKPVPFRLCLGDALIVAQMLHVFLHPENGIVMANFWQFANEYWGMVKGYQAPYVRRPMYYPFYLYAKHFGDVLLEPEVQCATYDNPGGWGVVPMTGPPQPFRLFEENLLPKQEWTLSPVDGVTQGLGPDDTLVVRLDRTDEFNYYHAHKTMPVEPSTTYRLSGEIRVEGLTGGRGAQLQIGDARGWTETRSAALTAEVNAEQWTPVSVDYLTLPDATAVQVIARRLESTGQGTLYLRNVKVQRVQPRNFGAQPILDVNASRSADGLRICLMIVNRALNASTPVTITVPGAQSVLAETLTGPTVDATNEQNPTNVHLEPLPAQLAAGQITLDLPKHSLTAVVVRMWGQGPSPPGGGVGAASPRGCAVYGVQHG